MYKEIRMAIIYNAIPNADLYIRQLCLQLSTGGNEEVLVVFVNLEACQPLAITSMFV